MKVTDIVSQVKQLGLPADSYVVFGSCPMAAAGIREANDIDMLVRPEVYQALLDDGWQILDKGPKDRPATRGIIEAHPNWDFSPYSPTLPQLLATATFIEGIPFASLAEVRKWKQASGLAKHDHDIQLIDEHLGQS